MSESSSFPISVWPTIRPECELGLGCMYSSPAARFSSLHTSRAFGNSEKPPRNKLAGCPRDRVTQNVAFGVAEYGSGSKGLKRPIISCAQLGSKTYERRRTNQEVYYQPTGAKTQ